MVLVFPMFFYADCASDSACHVDETYRRGTANYASEAVENAYAGDIGSTAPLCRSETSRFRWAGVASKLRG